MLETPSPQDMHLGAVNSAQHDAIEETAAAQEICDRVEGKAVARVEHGCLDGLPIDIRVRYEDEPLSVSDRIQEEM